MKKILCLALMLMPLTFVKASEGFETKSGIVLEQEIYDFIKEFGYSDEMIYEMSEDDLNIFVGADLDTVEMTKQTFYLPPEELPHGGISTFSTTNTTPYKTIVVSLFYNEDASCYQLASSVDFHTVPKDSLKSLDFLFLTWGNGNEKSNGFIINGYYVNSSMGVYTFTGKNTDFIEGGEYRNLSSHRLATTMQGIMFLLPSGVGLTDATIAIAQRFTNIPTNTYVQNLEQYYSVPVYNQSTIETVDLDSSGSVVINNPTSTNQLVKYKFSVAY